MNPFRLETQTPSVSIHQILSQAVKDTVLLVAGGRPPAISWLCDVARGKDVWCADSGVNVCHEADIFPAHLIGDADSARSASWRWAAEHGASVQGYPPEKDFTDTQLALQKIKAASPATFVFLTGCFGGRFDHAISTLYSLVGSGLCGCLGDDREMLLLVRGGEAIECTLTVSPKAISLLSLSEVCDGITLCGTHWPLFHACLKQSQPYAISNVLADDSATIRLSLTHGILGLYLCFDDTL